MKKTIQRMLLISTGAVVLLFLTVNLIHDIFERQGNMVKDSQYMFEQIHTICAENQREMERTVEQIDSSGISRAKAAAYLLKETPAQEINVEKCKKMAEVLQVDEINLFNEAGILYGGSVEKHYGLSLNSGEQIQFFLPMLKDKELTMSQEAVENTAEGKMMKYSAVWTEDKKTIVQVGVNPETLIHMVDDNRLPNVFARLTDSSDSTLVAISPLTHEVLGSTRGEMVGMTTEQLGISESKMNRWGKGFYFRPTQKDIAYGVFIKKDDIIFGRMMSVQNLFNGMIGSHLGLLVSFCVIIGIVCYIVSKYIDEKIIYSINGINQKLQLITAGDLNVQVQPEVIPEFNDMSDYINEMVDLMKKDLYQDALTGLYSRRAFYFELEKYFNSVTATEHAALFMVDADYLKYVNDVYGHEIGDEYLKKIVELLEQISAPNKLMARLGGDEFAILIPKAESEAQLQGYFDECMQIREDVKLTISSQLQIPILFSVGMSIYPLDGDNYHVLLKEADNKMYQDKQERKKKGNRQAGR